MGCWLVEQAPLSRLLTSWRRRTEHGACFDNYGFRCVTDMNGAPLDEQGTFDVEG
jgi:hypothetical protein